MPAQPGHAATVVVLPSHWARVEPVVPEVQDRLLRLTAEFTRGGPLGHAAEAVLTDQFVEKGYARVLDAETGRVVRVDAMRLPQGLVSEVVGWLTGLGYAVEVRDRREDSPRWVRGASWKRAVPRGLHKVVNALAGQRALRVVAGRLDQAADVIAAVAAAYPEARIAVGVATRAQLRAILRRLRPRLAGETLGVYAGKRKRPGRVSVGLIRQLPRGGKGDFDLLALPFAETTVGDAALEVVTSGQYRRLLSFTPYRWSPDGGLNRRLLVAAGGVFPPPKPAVPVTALVLDARGARPAGKFADPLDAKRKLYWHNARRNRRVAEVAGRLVLGARKAAASLVVGDSRVLGLVVAAAKAGVAVLVETPAHARELAALLPGWAVWTADDLDVPKPRPGCGVIATELAADETVLGAGVLVRATGTRWPLPDVDCPWVGDVDHGVLVDFGDRYHPAAARNAEDRVRCYREAGMAVWEASCERATGE